jgi:hypothetical protein
MKHTIYGSLLAAFALAASHCAPSTGFLAQGTVAVNIREGSGAPSSTGFSFPPQTRIDPTLPQGRADGFVGTCSVGPNGRSLVLQRSGGDALGLQSATFTLPDWSRDECTDCQRGTVSFVVGNSNFTGTHVANATSPCTFRPSRMGSYDMKLQVQCRGLQSGSRTADLDVDLSLDLCNGPMTRN